MEEPRQRFCEWIQLLPISELDKLVKLKNGSYDIIFSATIQDISA